MYKRQAVCEGRPQETESHDIDGSGGLLLPGFIDAQTHLGLIENGIAFEGDDCNEATDPFTPQMPYGCSQTGHGHAQTRKLPAALGRHPNAGAVLVLSLGCENLTHEQFLTELGEYDHDRIKFPPIYRIIS